MILFFFVVKEIFLFFTVSTFPITTTILLFYLSIFTERARAHANERAKIIIIERNETMKIIFDREAVSNAVAPLMCAIGGKSTVAATEGILMEGREDGTCVMTTFDLKKGIRIVVDAQVEEVGAAVINAQKFIQTLRVMEGQFVTLTVSDNMQACIHSGKSNHKMTAINAADYPEIPRLVTEYGFSISQSVLKSLISKVMYAMAVNDDVRPVLNGCFFKVSEDSLLAVSCDSYKMAKYSVRTDIQNENNSKEALNFSFIIPNKTITELYKLLKDDERETARIYMSRKNIVFNIGGMIFFSSLIEGQYIDYDCILGNKHRIFVNVNRDMLISALERAALVTEEKIVRSVRSHVKLAFEDGVLKISAISTLGSTYDELDVDQQGGNLVIAFNNRFLIDSLRASEAETVKISMTSEHTNIHIEPAEQSDDSKELFFLLPVRMKD